MRYMLVAFILILTQSPAEITVTSTGQMEKEYDRPEHPILRPSVKSDRPSRPVQKYMLLHQDNHYYTNVISDCDEYLDIIEKQDREIAALKQEINRLRSVAQEQLRKELKKEYEREMKKFEERNSGLKTQNKLNLSNEKRE